MEPTNIAAHPVHLGIGATAEIEPMFTGSLEWYTEYVKRHGDDGPEGRLVSMHEMTESWSVWEMHPRGSELVLCTGGAITLHQEGADGQVDTVTLGPGQYVVNAPGVWHTADIDGSATVLFITAGEGTQHRAR